MTIAERFCPPPAQLTARRPARWKLASTALTVVVSCAVARAAQGPNTSAKVARYVASLMRSADANRDGRLERSEWSALHGDPEVADANRDGVLTTEEIQDRILSYSRTRGFRLAEPPADGNPASQPEPPQAAASTAGKDSAGATLAASPEAAKASADAQRASRRDTTYYVPARHLPDGLPEWFTARDTDGDGQLSLSEFAPSGAEVDAAEFQKLDRNNDGVVTAREVVASAKTKAQSELKSRKNQSAAQRK
jgi:hypothetical protein